MPAGEAIPHRPREGTILLSYLTQIFNNQQLLPHATCLLWRPDLLWLHAVSDVVIAASYYSIPIALTVFAFKRQDLEFRWMFLMFGVFILACGTTHVLSVWTLWVPAWGLSGVVKGVTAIASIGTAALLWPLIPKALAVPGPDQWRAINGELTAEVAERRAAEAEVRRLNDELEERVSQRTAELEAANQLLRNEIALRIETETQLLSAKLEAERANMAKSRFLAAASHDLRQPVQSMFWFFGALEEQVHTYKIQSILDGMEQSLAGLKLLLDSLLDASKLDAGIIVPKQEDVAIGPLLARIAAEYGPSAAEAGLRFRTLPSRAMVRSDAALLERIIRNFIQNALRYTTSGGIVLGTRFRQGRLRIVVADTGLGIPEEKQEEIFEEFVQLGNPERDRSKGLGLGLAIVRRLSRLLGHKVGLRSRLGHGSCFFVETELIGFSATAAPAAHPSPAGFKLGVVLVIEDEALVRRGLCAMLQAWGYTAIGAESGAEAVAELTRNQICPDIILADYRLRNGEVGPDAIAMVYVHCGHAIPAVIVTGDTAPERIREAQARNFRLLHKPIGVNDLRQLVGNLATGT